MRKRGKKLVAMALAMSMAVSTVSMQALADESVTSVATDSNAVENADGTTTNQTITTTTTTDPETGKVTVNVVIENTLSDTNKDTDEDDGVDVSGESERTENTITDGNGALIEKNWVEDGTEKKEWIENIKPGDDIPPVEVEVIFGGSNSKSESEETGKEVKDNIEGGSTETKSDITTITIITDRTVTVGATEEGTSVENTSKEMESLKPEEHDRPNNEKFIDDLDYRYWDDPDTYGVTGEAPDGYSWQLVGNGQQSAQYISRIYVIYKKDENGEPIKDENGEYVIDRLEKRKSNGSIEVLTVNGVPTTDINASFDQATGTTAAQGVLMDENGNKVYVYCCDLGMPSVDNSWFAIGNLEDVDYYASEDAEDHVRNIVTNGYWGTESGTGSLASIKSSLKDALKKGEIAPEVEISYKNAAGENVTETITLTEEMIEGLTSGEAMDMTQAAIWAYSNGCLDVQDGRDGYLLGNVAYGDSYRGRQNAYGVKTDDKAGMARMTALYNWLVNLEEEVSSTTVINDKNFVDDMSLTVGNKVAEHESNFDDNTDNDVYEVAMDFTLAFVPDPESDDLLVYLTDANGVPYNDANGNPIIRRLAGENTEGRTHDTITPDENGVYTLTGLQLSENSDFTFDLRLEGTQYLENGVYLYTAHEGIDKHQTMIGMAEGTMEVDISKSVTVKFDVDENNHVVAERTWHEEGFEKAADPEPEPTPEPKPEPKPEPDPEPDPEPESEPTPEPTPEPEPVVDVITEIVPEPLPFVDPEAQPEDIPQEVIDVYYERYRSGDIDIDDIPVGVLGAFFEKGLIPMAVLPATGDSSFVWTIVSIISAIGLALTALFDRKRKNA